MKLYHVTTERKMRKYHESKCIRAPIRGFTTLMGAMAWAIKVNRQVILEIDSSDCHKLPDHHNKWGEAWWVDHDVTNWKCVLSPKDA